MKKTFSHFAIILLAVFLASQAAAGPLAEREILSNNMVLLHAERRVLPIVTIVMAVRAGSIAEPSDKAGLAYLTAALLNEGTKKRTSREISEAIEFVGGSLSASAGADYTTISLSLLKKDIDLGFDLLSDILMNPVFNENEITRKKKITKNWLIQQNEEPGAVASIAFSKAVFGEHPYARQVQGTIESLDRINRQDIVDFHNTFFAPNNAIMTVVGDISRDELKALLNRHLGTWNQKKIPSNPLPEIGASNSATVIRVNKDLTQANIVLGHLGISRDNPDYYAITVMNYILGGGGFSSRLMDNIRDNKGLAYDVHSYFSANRLSGSFQAGLQTKNESANIAIEEVLREMERIRTEPVSDKDLQDAKSYLTGSFPLRIDSNSKIAGFVLAVEFHSLGLDYVDKYPLLINAVTKEDILRVARKYLDTKNYVLVVVGNMDKIKLKY
ncbi:MAG: insulinase family protein [Nitrospirae bacterium]|nr:insulinase family protein [Nitrospirota bacterium]